MVAFCARDADEVAATEEALGARRRRRRPASTSATAPGLAALGGRGGASARRARRRRGERQRAGDPGHRGELADQLRRRPDAHRATGAGGDAAPGAAATPRRSSPSPASPGGRPTSPPGPYGTAKTAIVGYIHGPGLPAGRPRHPGQHGLARATPTSTAGSGQSIEQGNPELFAIAVGLNPTGRMGTPEEVAARGRVPGQPGGQPHHAAPTSSWTAR